MTREEAIKELERTKAHLLKHAWDCNSKAIKSFDMAIEALKQEPCDDCISREAAKNALYDIAKRDGILEDVIFTLNALPNYSSSSWVYDGNGNVKKKSVQPKGEPRRKGKWEFVMRGDEIIIGVHKCSNCKEEVWTLQGTRYCPNCGADMREE